MVKRIALVLFLIPCLGTAQRAAPVGLPEPIVKFCSVVLRSEIADKGARFNATDVVDTRLPMRRLIGFSVSNTESFIWYEHGGRGYHQHLVRFRNDQPEQVLDSYVLFESVKKPIEEVLADPKLYRRSTGDEL
jgi:hypothetical protein